jgi:hypothetical protein
LYFGYSNLFRISDFDIRASSDASPTLSAFGGTADRRATRNIADFLLAFCDNPVNNTGSGAGNLQPWFDSPS